MSVREGQYSEFIEQAENYSTWVVSNVSNQPPAEVDLYCVDCGNERVHLSAQQLNHSVERLGRAIMGLSPDREHTPKPIDDERGLKLEGEGPAYQKGTGFIYYYCAKCKSEVSIAVYYDGPRMTKFGQWPSRRPQIPEDLRGHLKNERVDLYKQGRLCEQHGFGIGASAYYRRLVEDVIDELLDEIQSFLIDDEALCKQYQSKLNDVQGSYRASDKIAVVKELLPGHLRPGGRNPLGRLYQVLSENIHSASDAEALRNAKSIRVALSFLMQKVNQARRAEEEYKNAFDQLD